MRNYVFCIITMVILAAAGSALAQNNSKSHNIGISIPEVALLDLESSSSTINISPKAPNEAGSRIDFSNATNSDIWVNYSSVTSTSQPSRKVSAFIEGQLPDGVKLSVSASNYTGNGAGKTGTPSGTIKLTNNMQDLITEIGSCYTGDGTNNGHKLTYSLELEDGSDSYADLRFDQSNTISVTYILTDLN